MAGRAPTADVKGQPPRLLLDEMFSPRIAQVLRARGFDVLAVAADPELRTLSDAEVYAWAGEGGRWVVTENAKDFRRLVNTGSGVGVLYTSSRRFPRSRRNLGPLIDALDHWLVATPAAPPFAEDWLMPVAPHSAERYPC